MRIIRPGHLYYLENFAATTIDDPAIQTLQFIEKMDQNGQFVTTKNGTTNEEVLRVLIDRIQTLNAKAPCRENSIVITKLEESLMWLEKRTADRKSRGVEGSPKV